MGGQFSQPLDFGGKNSRKKTWVGRKNIGRKVNRVSSLSLLVFSVNNV